MPFPLLMQAGHFGGTMRDVFITGLGLILPNCDERETFWSHVRNGESQLSLQPEPTTPSGRLALGRILDFNPRRYLRDVPERYYERFIRAQHLYLASVARACDDAGLPQAALRSTRAGLFDGTSRDNVAFWHEQRRERSPRHELPVGMPGMSAGLAASIFGVRGPVYTFTSTCASGVVAVGHALRELQLGEIDLALASGHDALLPGEVLRTYREAGLLNEDSGDPRTAVRAFVGHSRNVFGEGAVTLALETRPHAEARGARILAKLAAYRYGNSGEHPTHPDRTGRTAARLISEALERAGVSPQDVGFVLGHGNGVQVSDQSELEYMRQVFGSRAREVALLSTKPLFGHTLGASGVVNAAAGALMLHEQFIAPTINIDESLAAPDVFHQPNRGEARGCEAGLVVCYGIGGQHAVLVLQRYHRSSGDAE